MWCVNCRSDVATEVEPVNRRVHCASCGGEIAAPHARSLSRTQQARELLDRWAQDRAQGPLEPAVAQATASQPQPVAPVSASLSEANESAPKFRVDSPHDLHDQPAAATRPETPHHAPTIAGDGPGGDGSHRVDASHGVPAPHAAFPADSHNDNQKRPSKWVAAVGQTLAYIGVLGLMAGTCLVILGHFRGPDSYAPTGWLITMAGQMLLFLGVVTLVSSGMEETTNTVAERIDRLGEKLLRIEQATDALRGMHFPGSPSTREAGQGPSDDASVQVTRRAS